MSQDWHNSSVDQPVGGEDGWVWLERLKKGVNASRTMYRGSGDPSSGASPAWGATELGVLWLDDSDPIQTTCWQWSQLDLGPTYGWRLTRIPKVKWLTAPSAWTFSPASPAAADVAWTAQDLASQLDTLQDSPAVNHLVLAVYVSIKFRTGASETVPLTDDCYIAFRTTGGTNENRFYPQVQNRFMQQKFWLPLSTLEKFDFKVEVGGGTPAFEYELAIEGLMELAL